MAFTVIKEKYPDIYKELLGEDAELYDKEWLGGLFYREPKADHLNVCLNALTNPKYPELEKHGDILEDRRLHLKLALALGGVAVLIFVAQMLACPG